MYTNTYGTGLLCWNWYIYTTFWYYIQIIIKYTTYRWCRDTDRHAMPCHAIDHDMAWHSLIDIASTPTSCARRAAPTPSMARRHSHRAKISTPPAGPVDRSGRSGHVWGTTICDKPELSGRGWLCRWLPPAKFLNLVDLVDLLVYLLRVQDCNKG